MSTAKIKINSKNEVCVESDEDDEYYEDSD